MSIDGILKIRAIAQGYHGDMLCIFAAMDEATGFLMIDNAEKFDPYMEITPDLTILTNINILPTWTMFFKEQDLKSAIEAYHNLDSNGLIELESGMERYAPVSAIQINGIKETGIEYRFSELNNGHVAVLMCALFAEKQRNIRAGLSAQVRLLHGSDNSRSSDYVIKPISVGYLF